MKYHFAFLLLLLFFEPRLAFAQDWRTADRSSAGLAPLPKDEPAAVVQVYAARTFGWRRHFAVHSWIATKEAGATSYRVYHVMGWKLRWSESVVSIENGIPDGRWYGNEPDLLADLRGAIAQQAIAKIDQAARSYAYPRAYRAYPGPNSNTFVSHILRHTPEIGIELPPHAIGKDWLGKAQLFDLSETGTGIQFSLFGLLGFTLGLGDGIEINILGLSFGIDLLRPALKLPLVGRLGLRDKAVLEPKVDPPASADPTQPKQTMN